MHPFERLMRESIPTINVVGIDPGTDKLGFSVYNYHLTERRIVSSAATTLVGSKMISCDPFIDVHGKRARRLNGLSAVLTQYFQIFNPVAVACEHPFYNMARPSAFEPLLESILAVRSALFEHDPQMQVIAVDPSSAKNAVGAKGGDKKDKMQLAVQALAPVISFNPLVFGMPLESLDEHSIDALAVGKWYVNQLYWKKKMDEYDRAVKKSSLLLDFIFMGLIILSFVLGYQIYSLKKQLGAYEQAVTILQDANQKLTAINKTITTSQEVVSEAIQDAVATTTEVVKSAPNLAGEDIKKLVNLELARINNVYGTSPLTQERVVQRNIEVQRIKSSALWMSYCLSYPDDGDCKK